MIFDSLLLYLLLQYPVIEEPVDVGVGIVASTDSWSVKLHAVTKSLQTNDVLVGSASSQPSRVVRQMLASVKSMHTMNMPPDFVSSVIGFIIHVWPYTGKSVTMWASSKFKKNSLMFCQYPDIKFIAVSLTVSVHRQLYHTF